MALLTAKSPHLEVPVAITSSHRNRDVPDHYDFRTQASENSSYGPFRQFDLRSLVATHRSPIESVAAGNNDDLHIKLDGWEAREMTQAERSTKVKTDIELDIWKTVSQIQSYKLTNEQLFEVAKLVAARDANVITCSINDFKLTNEQRYEIAKLGIVAPKNKSAVCEGIKNYGLTNLQRFEIAKIAAVQSTCFPSLYIENFKLTNEQRFKIAKLAASRDGRNTSEHIENYRLTNKQLWAIFKIAARQDVRGTVCHLNKYGLQDRERILKIVVGDLVNYKTCTAQNKLYQPKYLEHTMSWKQIANPKSKPLRVLYGCIGPDISSVLYATNATAVDGVDTKRFDIKTFKKALATASSIGEIEPTMERIFRGHWWTGDITTKHGPEKLLVIELRNMGVDLSQVDADSESGEIKFNWAYPGEALKERTLRYHCHSTTDLLDPDLNLFEGEKFDVYYEKAPIVYGVLTTSNARITASNITKYLIDRATILVNQDLQAVADKIQAWEYASSAPQGPQSGQLTFQRLTKDVALNPSDWEVIKVSEAELPIYGWYLSGLRRRGP